MSNRIEDYVNRDNRLEEMYKKAQSLGFSGRFSSHDLSKNFKLRKLVFLKISIIDVL